MTGTPARWGAYGLHLLPTPSTRWLVPAPPEWPTIRLATGEPDQAPDTPREEVTVSIDGPQVRIDTQAGWRLKVDLEAGTATYRGMRLDTPEFVHPGLAAPAALFSRSWGHDAFHAGAVVLGDRAWGVVGPREAGKTTLLAALAGTGIPVLADDLLILADGHVLAGPRCLDLRPPPMTMLPAIGVRAGVRHRVTLGSAPPRVPLGGWIFLSWGEGPALTPAPVGERLHELADAAAWLAESADPTRLLDAAAFPGFRLSRPRDRSGLDTCVEVLSSHLGRG